MIIASCGKRVGTKFSHEVRAESPFLLITLAAFIFFPAFQGRRKEMDVDRQDAFSRTLESRPRQRASLAHSQSRARTVAFSHGGENAVDRLSRVFEQDRRSSADIVPPVTTTAAPKRPPPPPTKPPSLRATTYTNRPHDPLPSPSSESLISPSSTGTVATSVTSYASDVQSHIRSSKETEENFPEQKEHNSNVDETSLAFQDIRARFQQKENAQV